MVLLLAGAILRSRWVTAVGAAALLVVSWSPTVWLVSQPLEGWYSPITPHSAAGVGAVVVLSGNVWHPLPSRPFPIAGQETYQRTMYAGWLQRELGNVPVLACGGNPGPPHVEAFATTMQRVLAASGVPPESIWTETRSLSTYENARFAAELLRAKGIAKIALITEAYHMPRAERCFRKQGLQVVAAPTGFRTLDFSIDEFVPGWGGIRQSELVLHEAVGLAWYWMRGRI